MQHHVPTRKQIADVFTKCVNRVITNTLVNIIQQFSA